MSDKIKSIDLEMTYPTDRRGELQTDNCFVSTKPQALAMTSDDISLPMTNQPSRTKPMGVMRELK